MNTEYVGGISRHLKELADKNLKAKALFECLATYGNNMRKTYIHTLSSHTDLTEYEIREVFKQLEQKPFEIGELRVGRRGHRTRFQWDAPLTAVAAAALGIRKVADIEIASDEWEAEASDVDEGEENVETSDADKKTHRFHLRRDFEATLILPADFAAKDVERLCSFLKTLPVD